MTADAPYLIVRAAAVYVAAVSAIVVWAWQRPNPRALAGGVLASAWNIPALLAVHLAAARLGWWHFDARGGLLLGMPVDLYLAWAWMWGFVPALAFPRLPLVFVAAFAFAIDVAAMPAAAPVVRLGPSWLVGEAVAVVVALLPAQLLARWTARDERLERRAVLQVFAFAGLLFFVIPAMVFDGSGTTGRNPFDYPVSQLAVALQALGIAGVLGLSAVQEFVERGGGTPVPFDPPRRLVTTGAYAYVRNPMQLTGVILLLLLGVMLDSLWLSACAVLAAVYSVGLAGWDEDEDLRARFGDDWLRYREAVPRWIPRWRPWQHADRLPARLFVAQHCGMCHRVGRWFAHRAARGLAIAPAESHPARALTRITYEPADGSRAAEGVEAVARALEHLHFGWAFAGFVLRLPIVRPLMQLLIDASGGEARLAKPPASRSGGLNVRTVQE